MTEEQCYSALGIAAIVSCMELGCREESRILDLIWEGETEFLAPQYKENRRKFILDVGQWIQYFYDKPIIDKEYLMIQKDFSFSEGNLQEEQVFGDIYAFDLFFKNIRIRILYGGDTCVRVKLRTILREYGYQRRSKVLLEHIKQCLDFYRLEVTLRGRMPCAIENIDLDQILIFRMSTD